MIEYRQFVVSGIRPRDVSSDDWNPRAYEEAVVDNLRLILETRVGQRLTYAIRQRLLVAPFEYWHSEPNAFEHPGDGWRDALPTDEEVGGEFPGTGRGDTVVHIRYTPGQFARPRAASVSEYTGLYPFHSDSVLVHELFHVVEAMTGRLRRRRIGPSAIDIPPTTEHRAVRIENMYNAEVGYPLRGPYGDTSFLMSGGRIVAQVGVRAAMREQGPEAPVGYRGVRVVRRNPTDPTQAQYLDFERQLIGAFMREHPILTDSLRQIPRSACWYNPFEDDVSDNHDVVLLPGYWETPELGRAVPVYVLRVDDV